MKKNQMLILGVVGLFFVLAFFNLESFEREARPVYDEEINNFELKLLSKAPKAEVGDIYWAELNVDNPPGLSGSMFVQCSILDRTIHDWIGREVEVKRVDNCMASEPFTQTAMVSLDSNSNVHVKFSMIVPDNVGGDNVLYCAAFERCNPEGLGDNYAFSSDEIVEEIKVIEKDSDVSNDNIETPGDTCKKTFDCKGWLLGDVKCVNGYCVDTEDTPEENVESSFSWPDMSDVGIGGWAGEHKYLVLLLGLAMVSIAMISVYSPPKYRGVNL